MNSPQNPFTFPDPDLLTKKEEYAIIIGACLWFGIVVYMAAVVLL